MRKKKTKKKENHKHVVALEQSEMILPSVLSEASSLEAEGELKKREGRNEGKGLIQMIIGRKRHKRKGNMRRNKRNTKH